jgi:ligand-binding sensor domain-containing protein
MKKYRSILQVAALLVLIMSCSGQTNTQASDTKNTKSGTQKLLKNHFITKYPDENFFVQCGLKDKAGNMWFGTAGDGIYRYDGTSFINFTRADGLCHNDILCCAEDKSGTIWFGTRNGIIRYKPSGGPPARKDFISFLISTHTISNSTKKPVPYDYIQGDNFVWSIMQDKTGKIWFGTNKGIYTCNPAKDTSDIPSFIAFLDNDDLVNTNNLQLKEITDMQEDKSGNIWLVSGYYKADGICRYDGRAVTNYKPDSINSFRSVIAKANGDLLFLNPFKGIYRYDGKTFSNFSEKAGLQKDTLVSMAEDSKGNLWLGASSDNFLNEGIGGVWRYNGNSLKRFTTKDGLSHNCVFCIVEGKDGNIWFGTRNTGLCRYDGKGFVDFTDR